MQQPIVFGWVLTTYNFGFIDVVCYARIQLPVVICDLVIFCFFFEILSLMQMLSSLAAPLSSPRKHASDNKCKWKGIGKAMMAKLKPVNGSGALIGTQ